MLKVIDLFSGCGGLSYGFAKAGFDVVAGIDNWDLSLKTFKQNHPGAKTVLGDLQNLSPEFVAKDLGISQGSIDVIVGGPPCQGYSISGKRMVDDPRNQLYRTYLKFVEYFKPKAFLMENVPNLVSMGGGKIKDEILSDFEGLGYRIDYRILLASDYGVPQNRRRVFFVGLRNGDKKFEFPKVTHGDDGIKKISTSDAISDLPEGSLIDGSPYPSKPKTPYQKFMRRRQGQLFNHITILHTEKTKKIISMVPDGGNYKNLPKELWNTRKVNIAWTRYSSKKPSLTIDTGHNHHFHYKYNRVPTPREAARLQSFPDSFIFLGDKNRQLKQIGNAVPPLLAEKIAIQLMNRIQ
jgi:DNA (cytosine-5)-methyltransferase 1